MVCFFCCLIRCISSSAGRCSNFFGPYLRAVERFSMAGFRCSKVRRACFCALCWRLMVALASEFAISCTLQLCERRSLLAFFFFAAFNFCLLQPHFNSYHWRNIDMVCLFRCYYLLFSLHFNFDAEHGQNQWTSRCSRNAAIDSSMQE